MIHAISFLGNGDELLLPKGSWCRSVDSQDVIHLECMQMGSVHTCASRLQTSNSSLRPYAGVCSICLLYNAPMFPHNHDCLCQPSIVLFSSRWCSVSRLIVHYEYDSFLHNTLHLVSCQKVDSAQSPSVCYLALWGSIKLSIPPVEIRLDFCLNSRSIEILHAVCFFFVLILHV